MKRFAQTLPILLAAVLQLMPLLRNLVASPAAGSTCAFILRWGIGSAAVVGSVDAVSGASLPATFTSTNKFFGTVGTFFTNNVVLTIGGGNHPAADDYFYLVAGSVNSGLMVNGQTTTNTMPPGLTFKVFWTTSGSTMSGAIYGTPTAAGVYTNMISVITPSYGTVTTNLTFTIGNAVVATAPTITTQPLSRTNLTGTTASFSVTNTGTAPLRYQWYFNTNSALLNATNATLSLTNVQSANGGTYSVIITNTAGAVTSSPALLTVWQPPVITNHPGGTTNVAGDTVSFGVVAGGTSPLQYQWYFNTGTALLNATSPALTLTNIHLSQAGTYLVIVSNVAGSVTSSPALLGITLPPAPALTAGVASSGGGGFQFTFVPAVGLTNTVQTNGTISGGTWAVLTNVPPPASAAPVTVTDPFGDGSRFYRVVIQP